MMGLVAWSVDITNHDQKDHEYCIFICIHFQQLYRIIQAMPRRLRFTNTKNYERKRQAKKRLAKKLQSHDQTAANIKELVESVLLSGWNNLSNDSSDEIRQYHVHLVHHLSQ